MKEKSDLIIYNAVLYTANDSFAVASAMAVKDGLVQAVGSDEEILDNFRSSEMKNMKGAPVYPGFNDAHSHLYMLGEGLLRVDLRGAASFDEVVSRLKSRYDSLSPAYLAGDGWNQTLWESDEFPDNRLLNELFPDIPVVLYRIDYHAVVVNDKAITMLGVKPGDNSVPRGEAILKDGEFTGVFLEKSAERFESVLPPPDDKGMRERILTAQKECLKYGLTSATEGGADEKLISIYEQMNEERQLKIRTDLWLTPGEALFEKFNSPVKRGNLKISAVKLYMDGALGSRGALMIEPYSDASDTKGLKVIDDSRFLEVCRWAYEHGFQVATHCIGDMANREALRLYSEILEPGNDRRWRIEHAQIVDPGDVDLFGKYSIVPSIQPTHATSDMLWADERIGDRLVNAYTYKELLGQNGWIPSGTDFPIEQVDPLDTFYSAVFRMNAEGVPEGGFQMENALSRKDALLSMTIWAARSNFEEEEKGSLEPGKYADFVVLNKDIMMVSRQEFSSVVVNETYVGGELLYSLLP
jgi:predicted amidohydrolase YtcJ